MKNCKFISLIALFVIFLSSCSKEQNTDIIGEWKITDIKSTKEVPNDLKESLKESLEDMKSSCLFVIKADSTYESTISETTTKGKWKIDPESKILTLSSNDGEIETSDIIELTANKLVLSKEVYDSKYTYTYKKSEKKETKK
jgi:hypothetical protein